MIACHELNGIRSTIKQARRSGIRIRGMLDSQLRSSGSVHNVNFLFTEIELKTIIVCLRYYTNCTLHNSIQSLNYCMTIIQSKIKREGKRKRKRKEDQANRVVMVGSTSVVVRTCGR